MNIVAVNKLTNKLFESQSVTDDKDKDSIITAIQKDGENYLIEIDIIEMTDEELRAFIMQ